MMYWVPMSKHLVNHLRHSRRLRKAQPLAARSVGGICTLLPWLHSRLAV